jgi:hypothetical protein
MHIVGINKARRGRRVKQSTMVPWRGPVDADEELMVIPENASQYRLLCPRSLILTLYIQ